MLKPLIYEDNRGVFYEAFHEKTFKTQTNWEGSFVQDNVSVSKKGVLRGLHFQKGAYSQAKLVSVLEGAVIDVAVDLRSTSKTYGQYFKIILDCKNKFQLFVPKGFAHGFLALTENTVFSYKCDAYYHPESESGIRYDDKTLAIDWEFPSKEITISEKDKLLPEFTEVEPFNL